MQTFSEILHFLRASLIHKPGLLCRSYGLTLLDPHTWKSDNHERDLSIQWAEFIRMDHEAQELFRYCGFRLGMLAESVFENWLQKQNIDYRRGLQIFESKPISRTLGELDFLYKRNQEWQHFELAAKVYCFRPQNNDFIGPNKRDFFHRKLNTLKTQQLPLVSHPCAINTLKSEGLKNVKQSSVHFCGRLFYPPGEWKAPDYVNPSHSKGIYFEKHLPLQNFKNNNVLLLLPRYLWFLPEIVLDQLISIKFTKGNFAELQWANLANTVQIEQLKNVIDHFKSMGKTIMLSLLECKESKWYEAERILLLPHTLN